jgi:hypothetical protein
VKARTAGKDYRAQVRQLVRTNGTKTTSAA